MPDRRRQRDYVQSELSAVEAVLRQLPEEAVLERIGLESRARDARARLADIAQLPVSTSAAVELMFGGLPVVGTSSIDAQFSAAAIDAYQRAVSTAAAAAGIETLGARGPLPEPFARLHLTGMPRGSVGFRLEEVGQQTLTDSRLNEAVDEVEGILQALTLDNAEMFADAAAQSNPRVLLALREFLSTLRQSGAVCRIVTHDQEVALGSDAVVARAAQRITDSQIAEEENMVEGQLLGVLPVGRRFEFRTTAGQILKGRLSRELDQPEVLQATVGQRCRAVMKITTVERPGEAVSTRHVLLRVDPLP